MPDLPQQGWLPWLRQQRKKGLQVSLAPTAGMHERLTIMTQGCQDVMLHPFMASKLAYV